MCGEGKFRQYRFFEEKKNSCSFSDSLSEFFEFLSKRNRHGFQKCFLGVPKQFDGIWTFWKDKKLRSSGIWAEFYELVTKCKNKVDKTAIYCPGPGYFLRIYFFEEKNIFVSLWSFVENKFGRIVKTSFFCPEELFESKHLSWTKKDFPKYVSNLSEN